MLQDFLYAIRNLRRTPLFTIVALFSLALGIGANSAVFTIADQVLLRLIPVKHARQLVSFTSQGPQNGTMWGENRFSYPMYRDFRDHNSVFEGVAARFPTALNITYNNRTDRIQAELVTGTWFDTLGLTTALGRGLAPTDDLIPGAHPVVVLTYDYWKSRFNGNPGILNQTVLLNAHPMTVVGVAAPGYHGFDPGARVDVLVPTMMKAEMTPTWNALSDRRTLWLQLVGHLRAGVSPRQAQASLEPYYHGLLIMEMQTMKFRTERSRSGFATKPLIFEPAGKGVSDLREQFSDPLLILLGIVGLLLLIACANVANLLLARAVGRQKEIAIRLAVGASRFLLVRQLIAESLVLSLAGGAIGILFAWWTGGALLSLLANSSNLPLTATPDLRVFAFTFALSVLTGVLFGVAPAWQATSPKLALTLKDHAGNVSAGGGNVRLRKDPGGLAGRAFPLDADCRRTVRAIPAQSEERRPRIPPRASPQLQRRTLARRLQRASAFAASPRKCRPASPPSPGCNPPPSGISQWSPATRMCLAFPSRAISRKTTKTSAPGSTWSARDTFPPWASR